MFHIGCNPAARHCVHAPKRRSVTAKNHPNHPFSGGGHSISIRLFEGDIIEKAGISFSHIQGNRLPKSATDCRPELANHPEVTGVSVSSSQTPPSPPHTLTFASFRYKTNAAGLGGFTSPPTLGMRAMQGYGINRQKMLAIVSTHTATLNSKHIVMPTSIYLIVMNIVALGIFLMI